MNTVAVDSNTFDAVVIDGSKKVPVLVDFWAPWCGPCRALTPILEKLADEYAGRFILAKVNSDENPELSQRYGVRGIPAVKAFVDGEVVDEFTGAQPESGVRQFLDSFVPSPADELRDEAARVYGETRDVEKTLALLASAEQLAPDSADARIDRAAVLADAGRGDEARQVIDALPPLAQMDERVNALRAKLDLAQGAADASGEDDLKARIAADENDLDARLQLAHRHAAARKFRESLDQLLEIVQRDRAFQDDVGRKTMLKIFELLGGQGELVSEFRKRLAQSLN